MNKHQSYLFAENKLSTVSQSCLALSIQYFICSFISTLLHFLKLLLSYTNPEIDFYQVHFYRIAGSEEMRNALYSGRATRLLKKLNAERRV